MQPTPAAEATVPSLWVRRFLPLISPGGRVLDLAAGQGRHTRLLRANSYQVIAVDRDGAALRAAFADDAAVSIVEADLEDGGPWRLGWGFDGIIVTNYLHRPLLPALVGALAPGGALIYETFMIGNERFGRPSNPDFLLRQGELVAAFIDRLTILAFEQGIVAVPRPAAVQRIAAVKGAVGPLPPG
jgi:SAM-dependent methyltransferase